MRHERDFNERNIKHSDEDYDPTRADAFLRLIVLASGLVFWIGVIALVVSFLH